MKRWLLHIALLWAAGASAQEFGTHWIVAPQADSTAHVWFRHAYVVPGRPQEGRLTVATTGVYKLYVNEHNVGTALFYPAREPHSAHAVAMDFDVTRYLRPDTNVVAVLYAPTYAHRDDRQLSVVFHGRGSDGTPFSHFSDGDWLCKVANSALNDVGGETIDGRRHDPTWKSTTPDLALWLPVRPTRPAVAVPLTHAPAIAPLPRITRRRGYVYFDPLPDGVEYEFGQGFHGRVRLTLREARRGMVLWFGRTAYVCNGSLDEQASPVFAIDDYRRLYVGGTEGFRRDLITDIEAIETAEVPDPPEMP